MSRSYELRVSVQGYRPERRGDICGALHSQWDFNPDDFPLEEEAPEPFTVIGVDNLNAGLSADEMAARLAQAVWAANGAYCEVEVWSTFLDLLPPSDIHTWSEGDYEEWLNTAEAKA